MPWRPRGWRLEFVHFIDVLLALLDGLLFTVVTPAAVMAAATSPFSATLEGGGGGGASGDTFCLALPGGGGGRFSTSDMGLVGMDGWRLVLVSCFCFSLAAASSGTRGARGARAANLDKVRPINF